MACRGLFAASNKGGGIFLSCLSCFASGIGALPTQLTPHSVSHPIFSDKDCRRRCYDPLLSYPGWA